MENIFIRNHTVENILTEEGLSIVKSRIRSEKDLLDFIADCANVCGTYAEVKDVRDSLDVTAIPFEFYYAEKCENRHTLVAIIPAYKQEMNAKTLLTNARSLMSEDEIATYVSSNSDLFMKKTKVSKMLISLYVYKNNVSTFIDEISHTPWYEIPFAYTDWWEKRGMTCGEIQKEYLFK